MENKRGTRKWNALKIARIGVLGALSAILYIFPEIPVIPPIYKLDFSAVPALLAGFSMGWLPGLITLLIKDLTGLLHTSSMGVGELADFLMTGSFVAAASLFYVRRRSLSGACIGMGVGAVVMSAVAAAANYWIMVPFYSSAFHMPVEAIVGMIAKTIPQVDSLWKMMLLAVVPFNLLKGVCVSLAGGLLYRYCKPILGVKE